MWKIIDFGLAKFDEMYAADEGALFTVFGMSE